MRLLATDVLVAGCGVLDRATPVEEAVNRSNESSTVLIAGSDRTARVAVRSG